jgi:predicted nucleotidyltransferase
MNELIESHSQAIIELCRKHGVKEFYVFGSVLRKDFTATSDVDFLVEFDWSDETNLSGRFFGLKSELEELLGRVVDLVCYSAIRNPYFKEEVDETKRAIYAA